MLSLLGGAPTKAGGSRASLGITLKSPFPFSIETFYGIFTVVLIPNGSNIISFPLELYILLSR